MVKIAGSKKLKRQMAPSYWGITRKNKRFVVTVRPGSHKKEQSIPTAVFLRDTLKLVSELREAKFAIYNGKVTIDGVKIKSLHHGIGLMDVVELDGMKEIYRLVPLNGTLLKPILIQEIDKTKKLVIVKSKTTIKDGRTQIGFHDGRSLIDDAVVNVGDTCLMQIPEQKILEIIKLEKDSHGLIIQGTNAGEIGEIKNIKEGTFVLPKRVDIKIGEKQIEIPASLVMAIGKEKPPIQIR
ncbi:30S ribosomal protein S4e [Candidatus Nitrosopelagicus sp.]|nr:30S ribosomal protein S4e [Candidatus Nitrosopelagicus sp.]